VVFVRMGASGPESLARRDHVVGDGEIEEARSILHRARSGAGAPVLETSHDRGSSRRLSLARPGLGGGDHAGAAARGAKLPFTAPGRSPGPYSAGGPTKAGPGETSSLHRPRALQDLEEACCGDRPPDRGPTCPTGAGVGPGRALSTGPDLARERPPITARSRPHHKFLDQTAVSTPRTQGVGHPSYCCRPLPALDLEASCATAP